MNRKKITAVALAVSTAIAFSGAAAVVPQAGAQTIESLTAQINQLLAQIQTLQAQLAGIQGGGGTGGYNFGSDNLTIGSRGDNVTGLQDFLVAQNKGPAAKALADVFAGGVAKGYFGSLTQAALAEYQAAIGISPAAGYYGPITQAHVASLGGGPAAPGGGVTVPASGLSVSLAADNPAAATLVADTTSGDGAQSMASVLKLTFAGSGKVTSLKLKRQGISADSDVSTMYLYDGDKLVSDTATVSSTTYTFTSAAGLFDVSGVKSVTVKIDLVNGATAAKTLQFGLEGAANVASDAGQVGGSFPIWGNVMSTATAADLGKITIAHVSDPGTTMDAGLTDQKLWEFSLTSADQKIRVYKMKLTSIGTIDAAAFANLRLHDGTAQVGDVVAALDSDKTVTFDLSANPYEIATGSVKNIQLRGDVVGGSSRNFYFQFGAMQDLVAKDANYNVYLKPNQSDTFSILKATNTTAINTGSLSITKRTDSASGNVAKDALNVALAKFDVKATGEAVKVTNLVVRTTVGGALDAGNVDNGKVLLDGVQVGTTKDLDSDATADGDATDDDAAGDDDTTYTFGSSFIVNAGQTRVLSVVGDVKLGNGTSMAANDTIQIVLEAGATNAIRQSSGGSFNTPTATGNALTVSAGALTATKNPSVANMTVVKGVQNALVGSWILTAGAAEGMNVTSIGIKDGATGAETFGDAFANLSLWSGSTQLGTTVASPTATGNAVAQTFNLSNALNIPAGQAKQVDFKADVLSGATWTADTIDWDTVTGVGATTSQSTTAAGDVAGQTVTVATQGTLTVAVESSPTNPNSSYLDFGSTGQTLAAWKFSANNTEDLVVNRIVVKEVHADDAPGNVQNLKLFVGGVQKGPTIPAMTTGSPDSATFEDNAGLFNVPKNGDVSVTLKGDITAYGNAATNADGKHLQFRVSNVATHTATSDISAKGATSGSFAAGSAAADYTGNVQNTVRAHPTFAKNSASPSGSLIPGTVEVLRFDVTAPANGDVIFDGATNNIRFSITQTGGAATLRAANLYDAASGQTVATALSYNLTTASGVLDFVDVSTTIPASTTKTYYVTVDLSDYATIGEAFQLIIENAAADMSFSDNTTAADVEEANYVNVGLRLVGNTLVKP